jgi:DNA-directed RNA polymerase specialized sigma24 family protein
MKQISKERTTLYATGGDFCRIFKEDMQSLYLLALVLTADPARAEQCFVAGLNDCASGNQVFEEWARSWARRVVVKNAIRSLAQEIAQDNPDLVPGDGDSTELHAGPAGLGLPAEISALLHLPARERFAFVMSFCEGYSDHDCALLLGCTRDTLAAARLRAFQQLKDSAAARNDLRAQTVITARDDRGNSIDRALSARLATVA